MSTTEVNQFLGESSGEKHPAFKFAEIGDTIKGVIAEQPKVVDVDNIGKPGTTKKLVIALTDDQGETWSVWVRAGFMASAIQDAIKAVGAPGLEVGGRLAVRFSEKRDTGKPSPAHIFVAQYQAPAAAAVNPDDLL